jgi:phosphoribosylformylglycinamidine cyclo-ligase
MLQWVMDYKQAGVNLAEGYRAVEEYRELAAGTLGGLKEAVLGGIGGFAGMFSLRNLIAGPEPLEDPVLVSGTDGVGTKLDLAFRMKKYDTVGIDCVAMCVNDILCHGARPLFFLDYLACGKLDAALAASLVRGVAAGCREAGCVLLGGETAEMPGFYDEGKYDIAGFAAGIVDRKKIIDGGKIREGDVLLGLASSGPHSNGFSLIRRIIPDLEEDFGGMPIGMALLEPTLIYVKPVLGLMEQTAIHGMAHITGGGFYENIPRMFPSSAGRPALAALIREPAYGAASGNVWTVPPVFARIAAAAAGTALTGAAAQEAGAEILKNDAEIRRQFFNTYNMGIGLVLALAPEDGGGAREYLESRGLPSWEIGRVEARTGVSAGGIRFA